MDQGMHQSRPSQKVIALLLVLIPLRLWAQPKKPAEKSLSLFPILMYDTDIGFGYGGKARFVQYFSRRESLDVILFNSTKGERWYVLSFSIPDTEIRQGTAYPLSLDIKVEYDKLLKNYFYGIGPNTQEEDLTHFTFEKKELQVTLGRGFTPHLVAEAAYVLRHIRYYKVEKDRPFTETLRSVGGKFSPFITLAVRYDTSDSQIHPRKGFRVRLQDDLAAGFLGNRDARYNRVTLDARSYSRVLGENSVLAVRFLVQSISGSRIPIFEMSALGGGSVLNAMRGYQMNRFQDKAKWLANAEFRFPVWKRLGGNVFVEAGSVGPSLSGLKVGKPAVDIGWGLRYYLTDFVVRFDMGFSREGTGIYFNFGHVF